MNTTHVDAIRFTWPSKEAFSPPVAAVRVALITVGQIRSLLHPGVAASFALMRSSLLRDRHAVSHFMWLSPSESSFDEHQSAWLRVRSIYRPLLLLLPNVTEDICRPQCGVRCDRNGHDDPINWLRQFYSVGRAYQAVQRWSVRNAQTFDWYVKLRPDLLHLQSLRRLRWFSKDAAYVPAGVMTRSPADQVNNDHMFVCPAGELCERYFGTFARYHKCSKGFRMRWPWQRLFAAVYTNATLRLFDHAYTIARPESRRLPVGGPECVRLTCSKDPHSTGCIVPRLLRFVARCAVAAKRWAAWRTQEEPAAVLQELVARDTTGTKAMGRDPNLNM